MGQPNKVDNEREEGYLIGSECFGAETAPNVFVNDLEVIKDWKEIFH